MFLQPVNDCATRACSHKVDPCHTTWSRELHLLVQQHIVANVIYIALHTDQDKIYLDLLRQISIFVLHAPLGLKRGQVNTYIDIKVAVVCKWRKIISSL